MAGERSNARLDVEAAVKGIGQINALADEIEALGGDASELRGETEGLSRELERLHQPLLQLRLVEAFVVELPFEQRLP